MALGAFVAGLLLAETEYRREIEVTIEPFKGLLLGLYLRLGRRRDQSGFDRRAARPHPRPRRRLSSSRSDPVRTGPRLPPACAGRREMALLLGPGGEFGFVMIGAALAGGLIDRGASTTLVTSIAISMLAIPALAKVGALIDPRPGARRRAAGGGAARKRRAARHHRRLRPGRRADRRHARRPRDPVRRRRFGPAPGRPRPRGRQAGLLRRRFPR